VLVKARADLKVGHYITKMPTETLTLRNCAENMGWADQHKRAASEGGLYKSEPKSPPSKAEDGAPGLVVEEAAVGMYIPWAIVSTLEKW
jgi:hypothetical protein